MCLCVYPIVCLLIYPCAYSFLFVCLPVCFFVALFVCFFLTLLFCYFIYFFVCPIYSPIYPSVRLHMYLSTCLSIHLLVLSPQTPHSLCLPLRHLFLTTIHLSLTLPPFLPSFLPFIHPHILTPIRFTISSTGSSLVPILKMREHVYVKYLRAH